MTNLEQLIKQINSLNNQGIEAVGKGDFNRAVGFHARAISISRRRGIPIDYFALSVANQAYAQRQIGEEHLAVLLMLEDAMTEVDPEIQMTPTYAGSAKLHQEAGLLITDHQDVKGMFGLKDGQAYLQDSVEYFRRASNNTDEVLSVPEIKNQLLRSLGILAKNYQHQAANKPDQKDHYLGLALETMNEELNERLSAGETQGQPLANAYHGMGNIQVELERFDEARDSYQRAQELTPSDRTKGTIPARLAYLEMKAGSNFTTIHRHLSDFLTRKADLTPKDLQVLKDPITEIANYVGGKYQTRLMNLFTS